MTKLSEKWAKSQTHVKFKHPLYQLFYAFEPQPQGKQNSIENCFPKINSDGIFLKL
jgi:hypothetical protein